MADALHPDMIGLQEPNYQLLADAIYQAEGGDKAKSPYGILSVKVKDADEARRIAINTARNNYGRWVKADRPGTYIEFLANRYTPPTADPKGNANWKVNVPRIYAALNPGAEQFPVLPTNYKPVIPIYRID